jgi:hypothetical protein
MVWSGLPAELVWGLIPRMMGVLYVVAFGSLTFQLVGIIGRQGTSPLAVRLQRARRDLPGVRRLFDFPTVFWVDASDTTIRLVPLVGVLAGVLAIYGGPLGYVGLLIGWILWLSVEPAGLIFPWDTMLQEAAFLVLFLPLTDTLPSWQASALPLPTVAFMFRWFVLRLMLGFAKIKFIGTGRGDSMYLRGFLIWAPLPTPLAWWAHHAPRWLLKASLGFMFYGEAIAPVLGFFSGPLRVVSFVSMAALMLGIQATGNWGYFNIGFIMLSLCLLDTRSSLFDLAREPWASRAWSFPDLAIHGVMALLFVTSLLYFIALNSWASRTWVHWPLENLIWNRRWARALMAYFRAIAPFHVINGYGVFPPNSSAPLRTAPVIEGSDDGKVWQPYGYRYIPTTAKAPLPICAPHHPRFDQALNYAAFCIHDGGFFSSLVGDGSPYLSFLRTSWLERAVQRLLDHEPLVRSELSHDPFPERAPKFIRVSAWALVPTTPKQRAQTGDLWNVRRMGELLAPRSKRPWLHEQAVAEPELFHYDFVAYKRRTRPLRELARLLEAGTEPDRAVVALSDLTSDEVSRFWGEFVPALAEHRGDWDNLVARGQAFQARFSEVEIYRFERLLQRFAWLLRLRTEPYFVRDAQPKIALNSNWRFEMLLHEIICDGRAAFLAMLAAPERAAERAARTTDQTQLWALAMMRHEMMLLHVRCFRWNAIGMDGYKFKLHGIFEYAPLLMTVVPPDEEFRPEPHKHHDGEFSIEGLYARPGSESQPAPS